MTIETNKDSTWIGTPAPVAPQSSSSVSVAPTLPAANTPPAGPSALPTIRLRPDPAGPATDDVGGSDGLIGQELCGYTIRRKLAEGGMGVIYEGVHAKIGRVGAIKLLKLEFCRSEDVVERFYQEARAVNSIRHDNIVDIYDFGRDPHGRVFFVMEYLEGEPLSARIARGPLGWAEAFPIVVQILRALKAAHDKGVIHRDLKPDNIWLRRVDGRVQVKLLDFGIAKLIGTDRPRETPTRIGSLVGTPHYMSPEQIHTAGKVDHRTDIYAMGVILYEMFAGVTPFAGDTAQAIMTEHLLSEPPRLANLPAHLGVPASVAEIVDRMLVKDPDGRYVAVADVIADLHDVNCQRAPAIAEQRARVRPTRLAATLPGGADPLPGVSPPRARARVRRWLARAAVVVASAGTGVVVWRAHEARPVTREPRPPTVVVTTSSAPTAPTMPSYDVLRATALTAMRQSLRRTEPKVRLVGAEWLGKVKDRPSIQALLGLTRSDPDGEVRGRTGEALGELGAVSARPLLAELEAAAPPPLQVHYAAALARLGDRAAAKRLLGHARSADLAVAFPAGLALGDVSPPGDRAAIDALRALAARGAGLRQIAPYAGAVILTKAAALRDASARKALHAALEQNDEGARLAAAEGLARLGDDSGRQVFQGVLANPASPNQLVAAVAQIALGEYGGLALITGKLGADDPEVRRLAARGLGEIGEYTSLAGLVARAQDPDWTVRVVAAAAIVAIVGLDPQVLAQASVDWARSALESQDWAVRRAAAGVLANLPAAAAIPLLPKAFADPDPQVRIVVFQSAGKLKTAAVAEAVVVAVKTETDAAVKEQQVKALGEIGRIAGPAAHDTLAQISEQPGRIGVIAAGSLIAVGDASGLAKLSAAILAPAAELRLAAIDGAVVASDPIVVPTLKLGLADRVFGIQLAAAEGLARYGAEKLAALSVLNAALAMRDAGVIARALAALARFGESLASRAQMPVDMIDSPDAQVRIAAVPIVRALPTDDGVPLLRRLVADPDLEVRRAAVDAIEDVAVRSRDQALRLYKPLLRDRDPVVRAKASGEMSRLVPPPPRLAQATPAVAPPLVPADPKVQLAFDQATAASAPVKSAGSAWSSAAVELSSTLAAPPRGDATVPHLKELEARLDDAVAQLDAAASAVAAAAGVVADAASALPSPAATQLADDAQALAERARSDATALRDRATALHSRAAEYRIKWTPDPSLLLAGASAALDTGDLGGARSYLDQAATLLHKSAAANPVAENQCAALYVRLAEEATSSADKRTALHNAQDGYRRIVRAGPGSLVDAATAQLKEVDRSLDELK